MLLKSRLAKVTLAIFLVFLITACNSTSEYTEVEGTKIKGYQVYQRDVGLCKLIISNQIFEDEFNIYSVSMSGCEDEEIYYIKDGRDYIGLTDAISDDIITIDNVLSLGYSFPIRVEYKDVYTPDTCAVVTPVDSAYVGILNGYQILRIDLDTRTPVGDTDDVHEVRKVVSGYNFGFIAWGSRPYVDQLGYFARNENGLAYDISSAIAAGYFTVEELYNLYICDLGRQGEYQKAITE